MFKQEIDLFNLFIQGKERRMKGRDVPKLLYNLAKSIYFDLQILFKGKSAHPTPIFKGKMIAYVDTSNNIESLKFLKDHLDVEFVTSARTPIAQNLISIGPLLKNFISIEKYFFLFFLMVHPDFGVHFNLKILLYYTRVKEYLKLFEYNRPRVVFISNDHEPKSRALIQTCEILKIPIFYFQHASVSSLFPPLNFTASFLYGAYSEQIYRAKKVVGDVHLVGNQRFDFFKEMIESKNILEKIEVIGLAYNELDNLNKIQKVVEALLLEDLQVILRPHPRDERKLEIDQIQSGRLLFSDSRKEKSIDYLGQLDAVIAGNSSILLEAALCRVLPVQYPFGSNEEQWRDYYEFIQYGVAHGVNSIEELINYINSVNPQESHPREAASRFDASVGSDFEFAVGEKILELLQNRYKINKEAIED